MQGRGQLTTNLLPLIMIHLYGIIKILPRLLKVLLPLVVVLQCFVGWGSGRVEMSADLRRHLESRVS